MNNKKYTILLFGESGSGKSTTINALANYLQYKTFDEATSGKFVKVIPSKITLLHPQTYDELTIEDEDRDANERHNDDGNSVTQSAKNYEFNFGDKQICIIDTPGMGDTRGVEVDKKNFKNILEHLKSIETLHAVCFLIKTITTRKTASFEYCLNQMLIHLPRSACANIMFCFTFSRNSFYGPSDGFATLKGSLASNKLGIEKINLKSGENCFYIDNEAFHYLLAKKSGYPFTSDQAKSYKESWDKSVKQMFNMITQITSFESFKVELVFKLIDYQNIIKNIVGPIGKLENRIKIQLRNIEDQKRHSKSFANNLEFQDNLEISEILVEEYKTELKFIREYIRKLIDFLVMNLNTNCHNLIKPHLNIFSDENKFEELSKRTKFSQDMTATSSYVKIENIIEAIRKNQSNQIKISQLQELENKMIDFVHSGNSIRKIMGIEPQKEVNPQKAHITSKVVETQIESEINSNINEIVNSHRDLRKPNGNLKLNPKFNYQTFNPSHESKNHKFISTQVTMDLDNSNLKSNSLVNQTNWTNFTENIISPLNNNSNQNHLYDPTIYNSTSNQDIPKSNIYPIPTCLSELPINQFNNCIPNSNQNDPSKINSTNGNINLPIQSESVITEQVESNKRKAVRVSESTPPNGLGHETQPSNANHFSNGQNSQYWDSETLFDNNDRRHDDCCTICCICCF